MNVPGYARYKPSEVEWLGDLPEHWRVSRLKYCVANIFSGGTPESGNDEYWAWDDDEGIPWVAIADMTRSPVITRTDRRITRAGLASKRLQILPAGTLLYSMYASLGKVATLRIAAATNQAILGIVPDERRVVQAFLRFWLEHIEAHLEQFSSSNTQDNLNAAKVRAMPLFLPEAPEQQAIAAFLDRETARLDRLVAKKRELIERLKEKRTALISRTVTRGLPPAAAHAASLPEQPELKPSGVDWLGEVPSHWKVLKISYGFSLIGSGTTPKSDSDEFYDGDVPWVTTSELRETVILSTKQTLTRSALGSHPTLRMYPPGTLLFAMYGATIGRLGILGIGATVNQACCAFAHPTQFVTQYVYYWLWMRRPVLVALSSGGGQPNLSQDDLRQLRLTAPPKREQQAIADYLDANTASIDALIRTIETAVDRLTEYRAALISAAVTGKIDVRGEGSK